MMDGQGGACQRPYTTKAGTAIRQFAIEVRLDPDYLCTVQLISRFEHYAGLKGLKDPTNMQIIICDQYLENVVEMKALHVGQLGPALTRFLEPKGWKNIKELCVAPRQNEAWLTQASQQYRIIRNLHLLMAKEGRLPGYDPNRTFTLEDLRIFIDGYLTVRRHRFFDARNVQVGVIKGDPLAEILNVDSFHISQVPLLIRSKCVIVPEHDRSAQGPKSELPVDEYKELGPLTVIRRRRTDGTPETMVTPGNTLEQEPEPDRKKHKSS